MPVPTMTRIGSRVQRDPRPPPGRRRQGPADECERGPTTRPIVRGVAGGPTVRSRDRPRRSASGSVAVGCVGRPVGWSARRRRARSPRSAGCIERPLPAAARTAVGRRSGGSRMSRVGSGAAERVRPWSRGRGGHRVMTRDCGVPVVRRCHASERARRSPGPPANCWASADPDLDVAHQEGALVEPLAPQPAGDLVVALAGVAGAAGRGDVVERVPAAPEIGSTQSRCSGVAGRAAVGAAAPGRLERRPLLGAEVVLDPSIRRLRLRALLALRVPADHGRSVGRDGGIRRRPRGRRSVGDGRRPARRGRAPTPAPRRSSPRRPTAPGGRSRRRPSG